MTSVPFASFTYDKHDPEWGHNLREKVATSIKEVLKSPLEAVLPAFLEVKSSTSKLQVTPHEKELIEIKQELDLLKREVRSRVRPDEVIDERRVMLGPEEALSQIRHYRKLGMSTDMIVERISRMGPPIDWILKQIKDMKVVRPSKSKAVRPVKPS